MRVLGISGSLRNARAGKGSSILVKEILGLENKEELTQFLKQQTDILMNDIIIAGREEGLPFDELYKKLQKAGHTKGLSNSEAALTAGLWGCKESGMSLEHVGLSKYFPMNGSSKHLEELKNIVLKCDAILISGPVYFGDRGSLVQAFIEFISSDVELRQHVKGLVYSGIAVGAKRNGGQETQLIYQIIDMSNLGMLAVGNCSETTSQYGGTMFAGDIGSAWSDDYGINTAIGAGKRLASVSLSIKAAANFTLKEKLNIGIWLVQDSIDGKGLKHIKELLKQHSTSNVEFSIFDITRETVCRCIACDICPTHHATRDEYTCIIKTQDDFFIKSHKQLMKADAILLAAYSPYDRTKINSVYQKFIERTRYIRRANYMLSDRLVTPFIITELNSNQNLHIRMLTSLIRHHTVLHSPLIAVENKKNIINKDYFSSKLTSFINHAKVVTVARLIKDSSKGVSNYNPLGYIISKERNRQDVDSGKIAAINKIERNQKTHERSTRVTTKEN